jgi:hypothetical protein
LRLRLAWLTLRVTLLHKAVKKAIDGRALLRQCLSQALLPIPWPLTGTHAKT